MVAIRVVRDVEEVSGSVKAGSWNITKNPPSWGRATGAVTRSEASCSNPSRPGVAESVGSMRREGNMTSGVAKVSNARGSNNRGRSVRNLPYPEFLL